MLLLYATDLIFTTRIRAEATAAGAVVGVARGVDSLRAKLAAGSAAAGGTAPRLVVVDLDADDAVAAIAAIRGSAGAGGAGGAGGTGGVAPPRIVAFVSHVRADLALAAREAGADEVMARSAFVLRLPELARACAEA